MVTRMPIYRHVVTGAGAAGDMWSVRVHSHSAVLNLAGAQAAWVTALASMLGVAGIGQYWPNLTGSSEAVTYNLNPATGRAVSVSRGAAVHMGTGGTAQGGPRDCVVVGLRTVIPGPAGRGRMFFPNVSSDNLTTTGLISTAAKTGIAGAVGAALVVMNSAGFLVGVWKPALADSINGAVSVTVGSVPGTQRRRSNKIPNSYVSAVA